MRMDEGGVMPPFQGDSADRAALAGYLVSLHDGHIAAPETSPEPPAAAALEPRAEREE